MIWDSHMKYITQCKWQRRIALLLICCFLGKSPVVTAYGGIMQDGSAAAAAVSGNDLQTTAVSKNETGQGEAKQDPAEQDVDVLDAESDSMEQGSTVSENEMPPVKILFVGNSFTRNRMDASSLSIGVQLARMAEQSGKKMQITVLANGGAKLQMYAGMTNKKNTHYQDLRKLLLQQDWDYIVLQEQSHISAFSYETEMQPALTSLKNTIELLQPNAKLLLYMTHGYGYTDETGHTYTAWEMQRKAAMSYYKASLQYGIDYVPAGMQFQRMSMLYPELPLYLVDHKHPTQNGYFIMAASFFYHIFGEIPVTDVSCQSNVTMTQEQADAIIALNRDEIVTDRSSMVLQVGEKDFMSVTTKEGQRPLDVTFYTSDSKVVEVNPETGRLRAKSNGKAVIIAQAANGCQAYCMVYVPKPLSFAREYYMVGMGETMQILPDGDADDVIWKSSRPKIAMVDPSGVITAKKVGMTHITVVNRQDAADRAEFDLYVSCRAVKGLTVSVARSQPAKEKNAALTLSWKAVPGAKRYAIYRSVKLNGKYRRIATTKRRKYTDSTAHVNRRYYYKVQAVCDANQLCNGTVSAPVKAMVVSVKKLQGVRDGKNRCRLTWKKNSSAHGYEIYRSPKDEQAYELLAVVKGSDASGYTDRSVQKKKSYSYRVIPYRKMNQTRYYGRAATVTIK